MNLRPDGEDEGEGPLSHKLGQEQPVEVGVSGSLSSDAAATTGGKVIKRFLPSSSMTLRITKLDRFYPCDNFSAKYDIEGTA